MSYDRVELIWRRDWGMVNSSFFWERLFLINHGGISMGSRHFASSHLVFQGFLWFEIINFRRILKKFPIDGANLLMQSFWTA